MIEGVGGFTLIDETSSGAVKLSGLAHAGGSTFYAVGQGPASVFKVKIGIDPASGAIRWAGIQSPALRLRDGAAATMGNANLEGIAVDGSSLYTVNETGPQIGRYDLATGRRLAHATTDTHPQLAVFAKSVSNRSWESLTRQPDGSAFWTANEEALTVDGPLATRARGTVVRLQKFDADLQPIGQWAYATDPIHGRSGTQFDRSGVVDLAALDDGRLLVLERSTGSGFRVQIYLVDFTGATDVSDAPFCDGLRGTAFTPVSKTRLFAKDFTSKDQVNGYFVGMTLGPKFDDGSRSLILIADNGGSLNFLVPNHHHAFYALRLVP